MTSYTRKLYNRDPAAAEAFSRQTKLHDLLCYGKTPTLQQFDPAFHDLPRPFGKRQIRPVVNGRTTACEEDCGHPACAHGCTLRVVAS